MSHDDLNFIDHVAGCDGLSLDMEQADFTELFANAVLVVAACLNHSRNGIMFL